MLNLPTEIWILILGLIVVLVFVWMMLTEWSYVGTGCVRRSYDWLAPWYEDKWRSAEYQSEEINQRLFLLPLLELTQGNPDARVLDLACGTGRVSLSLLQSSEFKGQIHGVDFSSGMLNKFREHLETTDGLERRVSLTEMDLKEWTCGRPATYDAVLLLEAAELIPNLPRLMNQIGLALKPGGLLITTQVGRRFVWLFRSRFQKPGAMEKLLADCGLEFLGSSAWRQRYDIVFAKAKSEI
jgi:ubiquinone/menaquinone biosynthesis C-methylase UbiE